jgi:thiamine pyrophosphate-dependent acetolactate synthase large subunit-like protein
LFQYFRGITNSITGLKNAQMAESPLLLLGGAAPTLLRGRGALQVHFLFYQPTEFY